MSMTPAARLRPALVPPAPEPSGDHLVIRGRRLELDALLAPQLSDPAYRAQLRSDLIAAEPFGHLVVDGWFNPTLLELVHEEFDSFGTSHWKAFQDEQQQYLRSATTDGLGPASQVYFNLVNSGEFVRLLGEITDIDDLMGDARLYGGGLHETRSAGKFGLHRDFDRHALLGLDNRMVFITYLNKGWQAEWGAALELWNTRPRRCERSVMPEFGRSVLLMHGPQSFHGHPEPMHAPAGCTRRSVATYYYQNSRAVQQRLKRVTSVFLVPYRSKRLRRVVKHLMPPILLDVIKKIFLR